MLKEGIAKAHGENLYGYSFYGSHVTEHDREVCRKWVDDYVMSKIIAAMEKVGLTPEEIDLIIESHRVVDYPPDLSTHIAKAQLQRVLKAIRGSKGLLKVPLENH